MMKFDLENGEDEEKERKNLKETRKFSSDLASNHSKAHMNKMIMNSLSFLQIVSE